MANALLTPQAVTREALALFINSFAFLKGVDRQYDSSFAKDGGKIGDTLKIRLPNDYIVRSGPTAVPQDTVEQNTTLQITSQKGIDVSFSSADRTLKMDDYKARVLRPAMNNLAADVASDLMTSAEGIPSLVRNVDGSNNTISPTANTWLTAGAMLDGYGVPRGDNRKIIMDPYTQANTVGSLSGLFNNQQKIGQQYNSGQMGEALGFDWMMDQSTILHTTGTYTTASTMNGAAQSGSTITVTATSGTLKQGDVITIAGVNAINRSSKRSLGKLQQFAVTADVAAGATSIPIYPAITASAGRTVPFATVDVAPANGAAVNLVGKASEVYRKNIALDGRAFTFASADLILPTGAVMEAERASFGGVSMRLITDYNSTSDQVLTRLDILYGWKLVRPEFAVVVADQL